MPEPRPPLLTDDQRQRLARVLDEVFDEVLVARPYAQRSRADLTTLFTRFAVELGQLADALYARRKERIR